MATRFRYGARFNGGTLQDLADTSRALTRTERLAFRRMNERREALREENPAEYRRAKLKSAVTRAATQRRHVPVTLAPIRSMEGC